MAWGIKNGILDDETYSPVIEKGWMEMSNYLTEEGGISNIQTVGKEPGPVSGELDKREYGYGAFILAGIEMANYYALESDGSWSGFPLYADDGQNWADTGGWMGWLEVSASPYVFSQSLNGWVYVEENPAIAEEGSWVYIFK